MATQYATFFLDGLHFGVAVPCVQEVLRYQEMTRVPLAPPVVEGLINLRGQIVTALDLRRRIGLSERPDGQQPMNIVVRTQDGAVSLLVDEIGDVVEVDPLLCEARPDTVSGLAGEVIEAVYKQPDRLLLVLDIRKVLSLDGGTALVN
jgi:purine-binding chemotaxis protein CheW